MRFRRRRSFEKFSLYNLNKVDIIFQSKAEVIFLYVLSGLHGHPLLSELYAQIARNVYHQQSKMSIHQVKLNPLISPDWSWAQWWIYVLVSWSPCTYSLSSVELLERSERTSQLRDLYKISQLPSYILMRACLWHFHIIYTLLQACILL